MRAVIGLSGRINSNKERPVPTTRRLMFRFLFLLPRQIGNGVDVVLPVTDIETLTASVSEVSGSTIFFRRSARTIR